MPIDKVLIPFAATNFYTAQRAAEIHDITEFEFKQRIISGLYRDISLTRVSMEPEPTRPEEVPEWGYDLRQALEALPTGIWWTTLFPGLAMTIMVVGLSLLGEGLNELIHPRMQKKF